MARLSALAEERTDLCDDDVAWLQALIAEWSLLADLSMSDLVLWLPTWNAAGLVAAAFVRPTTAPTTVPDDVVGSFLPRGADPTLDRALSVGTADSTAFPITRAGRVIAVVARHGSPNPRVAGQLEEVYQHAAEDLFAMLVSGDFPKTSTLGADLDGPRVGDGLVRLDDQGRVGYASPNAVSALRRLGLAVDVVGRDLRDTLVRLAHRPGAIDEGLSEVASGHAAGRAQIENAEATLLLQGIPIRVHSSRVQGRGSGALILVRDVTELRRRERALLSKDATIREIHHRVKNNLQTVAALLRLQARRAHHEDTRNALVEAELRIAAIAVVHEALSAEPGDHVNFDEVADRIIQVVRELAPAFATGAGGAQGPSIQRTGSTASCGMLSTDLAMPLAMACAEALQNAVEHADAAHIQLELGVISGSADTADTAVTSDTADQGSGQASTGGGSIAVARITDDGLGLPTDFTPGLGLQIVHSLIEEQCAGQVTVENRSGGGVVVTLKVPLA